MFYTAVQALKLKKKLEEAGIDYFLTYLLGLAGYGDGEGCALECVKLYNQIKSDRIGVSKLIMYSEVELYIEPQGNKHYVKKYQDMQERMDGLYDEIYAMELSIEEVENQLSL